jgi:hypothetical protein
MTVRHVCDDKLHLWVGVTSKTFQDFTSYFDLDYSNEYDSPDYIPYEFCKDLGVNFYDENFLVVEPFYKEPVALEKIILECDINPSDIPPAIEQCRQLGITLANAVFSLMTNKDVNEHISVPKQTEKTYNDLYYIGHFSLA